MISVLPREQLSLQVNMFILNAGLMLVAHLYNQPLLSHLLAAFLSVPP